MLGSFKPNTGTSEDLTHYGPVNKNASYLTGVDICRGCSTTGRGATAVTPPPQPDIEVNALVGHTEAVVEEGIALFCSPPAAAAEVVEAAEG